jgi:short-subunit dehydrogenase
VKPRRAATTSSSLLTDPLDMATESLRALGAEVEAVQADLATRAGVELLYSAARDRDIDALLANAGTASARAFLDQEFAEVQHVINTNITGTLDLIQKVARQMRPAA